jgi:hypothetical protein
LFVDDFDALIFIEKITGFGKPKNLNIYGGQLVFLKSTSYLR